MSTNKIFWDAYVSDLLSNKYNYGVTHSATKIEREFMQELKGKKILHPFCNFGMNTFVLEDKGGVVTGLDYNPSAIQYANDYKKRIGSNVEFICDDFFEYEFKDKYDVIFLSYGILDWVEDIDAFIDRLYDLLVDEGRLIMVEFTTQFFEAKFKQLGGKVLKDNQYEIKTDLTYRIGTPNSSIMGGNISEEEVIMRPYLHNTNRFISKLLTKGFREGYVKYYDHINFKMGNDIEIGKNRYKNKDVEGNMCFGMIYIK